MALVRARGDHQGAVAILQRVRVDLETELGPEHEASVEMREQLRGWQASPAAPP